MEESISRRKLQLGVGGAWRQRQADLCEFKASLIYKVSSRTIRSTQRNPVSKKQKEKKRKLDRVW